MTARRKGAAKRKTATKARGQAPDDGPLTLEQAQALALSRRPRRMLQARAAAAPTLEPIAQARGDLAAKRREERERRIRDYTATLALLKERGVKGLRAAVPEGQRRALTGGPGSPLQILAEGDSWFEYPVPFFGGGIIPRLEKKLGVPILNLAKAGDEVRFMLGVEERTGLRKRLKQGCPAGGPWDVVLFSGGGNDIVDNPMALWIRDYDATQPAQWHLHQSRFDAALALVRAGYEDLIALRDALSPTTLLVFHGYDFAIPDGRGVCWLGPWLKPTFELRKFPKPATGIRFQVIQRMLQQFAAMLAALQSANANVELVATQGTLAPQPSSWHNELHPAKTGFTSFAALFHARLKQRFPGRVL